MKISQKQLRRIIMEEMTAYKRQQLAESRKRQRLTEGTKENPIQITAAYLNALIKEEYAAFQTKQRLAESRRQRRQK